MIGGNPLTDLSRAKEPFRFVSQVHLKELTGLKARKLSELAYHLKTVNGSVIYYHTHHFLQQHQFLSPEPPNDFAYWVTEVLQNKKLGEKLSSINICQFTSIRALREKLVAVIENDLAGGKQDRAVASEGEEFHFIKAVSFALPVPYAAYDLREFSEVLKKITIHSIYYHVFEARIRLEKPSNDFSLWMEKELGEGELAQKISRLDPYTYTMEGLRAKIIRLIETRLLSGGVNAI